MVLRFVDTWIRHSGTPTYHRILTKMMRRGTQPKPYIYSE